jgi:hypothetical protein
MTTAQPVRKSLWKDTELGELARDLRAQLSGFPKLQLTDYTGTIVFPFSVATTFRPRGMLLMAATNAANPQSPVSASGLVLFEQKSQTQTVVTGLPTFSPTAGVTYLLTFLVVG